MSLEFGLAPAALPGLLRAPALAAGRVGRWRSSARSMVWHDTAAHALAAAGRCVVAERREWRLERLMPADSLVWPPGAPAPVLASGSSAAACSAATGSAATCSAATCSAATLGLGAAEGSQGGGLADRLLPVASLDGRERRLVLRAGDADVSRGEVSRGEVIRVTVLEAVLRVVAVTEPVCRVRLDGPAEAVAGLARALCETVVLRIDDGLSARAVALGGVVGPDGPAAAALRADLSLDETVALAIGQCARCLIGEAALAAAGATGAPVHRMRVAVRRLRSVLQALPLAGEAASLVALRTQLREVAARLGEARGWDVFLEGPAAEAAAAFGEDRRMAALVRSAAQRRLVAYAALVAWLGSAAWRGLLLDLALLAQGRPWRVEAPDLAAAAAAPHAAAAAARQWRRLRKSGRHVEALPAEVLHGVRKQAKRLRYTLEALAPLLPQDDGPGRALRRLSRLQEALGRVNDAAEAPALAAMLGRGRDRAYAAGMMQGYLAAREPALRAVAEARWRKLRKQG